MLLVTNIPKQLNMTLSFVIIVIFPMSSALAHQLQPHDSPYFNCNNCNCNAPYKK